MIVSTLQNRAFIYFIIMLALFIGVGILQSWNLSLSILNLCIISAIMALGVNIQWGYAGLFNVGVMGFTALGGLAAILVATPPVHDAWAKGGAGILISGLLSIAIVISSIYIYKKIQSRKWRFLAMSALLLGGLFIIQYFFNDARLLIEKTDPAKTGFLGGMGLPIIFAWPVGAALAAVAAWVIGKISLNLRSDYLAIATLGISEIIIAMLKNEDWLTRGVKNVTSLPRPVPFEIDLQQAIWFQEICNFLNIDIIGFSSIFVKLCFALMFGGVLLILLIMFQLSLHSPWGRMMRAIRDNEISANAMGKNIGRRHLQVFVIGSAVVGLAGAMLTTFDGQFTPASYNPLRFTFLIWVMVIVGGSGNNFGSILGAFLIWFYWIEAEPIGLWLIDNATSFMEDDNPLRLHLLNSAAHMRHITMGIILLLVMRFNAKGLLPEKK